MNHPSYSRPVVRTTRIYAIASLIFVIFLTGACARETPFTGQKYELRGKVVSVDKNRQQATIAHEEVKGFMSAMVMPFTVKDNLFDMLAPGDQVTATLFVEGDRSWIGELVIVKESTQSADSPEGGLAEPKPGASVPNFTLVNQDGKTIHFADYDGRALVITFIYTRCPLPEYCTLMSNNFSVIHRELAKNPDAYKRTHLISISIDPDYDTPKVLRSYGSAHTEAYSDEKFDHWEFATGTKNQVREVAEFFGLRYFPEGDQIVHTLRTAVITPDGKLFKLYRENQWKPEEILADLQSLLAAPKK